jgi:hypothetical protein
MGYSTRSAGFQPAVSPISNRQIARSRRALPPLRAFCGLETPRYSGLETALPVVAKAGIVAHLTAPSCFDAKNWRLSRTSIIVPAMKSLKLFVVTVLSAAYLAAPMAAFAQEKKADKPKPYPLEKCVVTDEKLGGHGKPYVFEHEGQELKLCCKGCLKDFKKEPAKYMKKVKAAEAKSKK